MAAVLLGLSTGHKVGLATVAGVFIAFAILSALVIPRYRPDFPGRGGLRIFILLTLALFVSMMGAVEVFGKEDEEEAHEETTAGETTGGGGETTGGAETTQRPARTIQVSGTDFAFRLPESELQPGRYSFDLTNDGNVEHNLVIDGPGVEDAATETIDPGQSSSVEAELQAGSYAFYCSVPGHRQAGMELDVTVG